MRSLAELPPDPAVPVASLYLDTRWHDEQQRRRVKLFAVERCREAATPFRGRGGMDRGARDTVARVTARIASLVERPDGRAGFILFASVPRGLWLELSSRLPVEPSFTFAAQPQLLPLTQLADVRDPVIVAEVDHRTATVYEVDQGLLVSRLERRFDYPGTHRRNDWFHGHRFYRVVGHQRRQNRLDAVRAITEACDRAPRARLVLAGAPDQVGALREALPERLRGRLLPDQHLDRGAPESEAIGRAVASLCDAGRDEVRQGAEAVVDAALAGGMAVLGPADVTLAVQERRVHALFLDRGLSVPGWHCKRCDALGTRAEAGCPYCGGAPETLDLANELARRVLLEAGEVHVVEPDARFRHFTGVAAALRPRGAQPRLGV
ncbi:MAG TPA: hypothetical protein VMB50_24195, partial [Myxococcales bacterium]|nr:hypothetical protein [Myxococcales bacterium]